MRSILLSSAAAALTAFSAPASAETVSGTGTAVITKDTETVRNRAEGAARREIVRAMIVSLIGADRSGEVAEETVTALADQIRPEMIIDRSTRREGDRFIVSLSADIDSSWMMRQLDNFGIRNSSQVAGGDKRLIFIYLDQVVGEAEDFSKPAETFASYDRRAGASFSDTSRTSESARSQSASSARAASARSSSDQSASRSNASGAFRASSSGAMGASGPNGSAAARGRSGSAGGFSGNSASARSSRDATASSSRQNSASSSRYDYVDQANVQAEVYDNVSIVEHVINRREPVSSSGGPMMNALSGSLLSYGVSVGNPDTAMSQYFGSAPPSFAEMRKDAGYSGFLQRLSQQNGQYFLGGTIQIRHLLADPATGLARCSGELSFGADSITDRRTLASDLLSASGSGVDALECASKVSINLAQQAGERAGPSIQNHWRNIGRASAGVDTTQLASYRVTLRGTNMGMSTQVHLLKALNGTSGVRNPKFVSSSGSEIQFVLDYAGEQPLGFAVYEQMNDDGRYPELDMQAEGSSVLFCLSGC